MTSRTLDQILIDNGAQRIDPVSYDLCDHMWGNCWKAHGDSHWCRNVAPCNSHRCTWCGSS